MSELKIGDKAPKFEGKIQGGKTISSEELLGKKYVLFFYPKDDTPGCTKEACNLRDNHLELRKNSFEIIGVSADSEKKHQKFIDKYQLPFPLISDEDKSIISAFGAWGWKKFMGREYEGIIRMTFVIDETGTIIDKIEKVKTKNHADQILLKI